MKRYLLILTTLGLLAVTFALSPSVRAAITDKFSNQIDLKTGEWGTVSGTIEILTQTLENPTKEGLTSDLYVLMTSDFKSMFDWENFKQSITEAKLEVLGAEILEESDEFAKVKMRLKSQSAEQDFMVILKKEDGVWKLYATEGV